MTSPLDYVFFQIDQEYTTELCTSNGFSIALQMGGEPGNELHHVREFGIAKILPGKLSSSDSMRLKTGDKIYFHFHTVSEENKYQFEGEVYYKVHYSEIYCAIRHGKIIMLGDHVFCQPIIEKEEDIITPGGIFLKPRCEALPLRAKVSHLPESLKNSELSIGDQIYFSNYSDIPIEIEGEKYYRMRYCDILAKYVTELN